MLRMSAFFAIASFLLPQVSFAEGYEVFNGKDLSGWHGDPNVWSVKEGVIRGEIKRASPGKGSTFLIWEGEIIRWCEIKFSYRCSENCDSGFQYASEQVKDDEAANKWVVRGYQYDVRNDRKFKDKSGLLFDVGSKRGLMCQIGENVVWNPEKKATENLVYGPVEPVKEVDISEDQYKQLFKLNDWNEARIRYIGPQWHYLNGRLLLKCLDKDYGQQHLQGTLALELSQEEPMWVEFTNITLEHLEAKSKRPLKKQP